uniref:Uncharacterized protein n=1 Tax=Cucumis melo TaxID=3656 RepID=A0A9I9EAF0_CUCME
MKRKKKYFIIHNDREEVVIGDGNVDDLEVLSPRIKTPMNITDEEDARMFNHSTPKSPSTIIATTLLKYSLISQLRQSTPNFTKSLMTNVTKTSFNNQYTTSNDQHQHFISDEICCPTSHLVHLKTMLKKASDLPRRLPSENLPFHPVGRQLCRKSPMTSAAATLTSNDQFHSVSDFLDSVIAKRLVAFQWFHHNL